MPPIEQLTGGRALWIFVFFGASSHVGHARRRFAPFHLAAAGRWMQVSGADRGAGCLSRWRPTFFGWGGRSCDALGIG